MTCSNSLFMLLIKFGIIVKLVICSFCSFQFKQMAVMLCLSYTLKLHFVSVLGKDDLKRHHEFLLFARKLENVSQGSHSSWKTLKTWKNGDSFSSLEKSWNFVIFAKYPGKMRQTLEI